MNAYAYLFWVFGIMAGEQFGKVDEGKYYRYGLGGKNPCRCSCIAVCILLPALDGLMIGFPWPPSSYSTTNKWGGPWQGIGKASRI